MKDTAMKINEVICRPRPIAAAVLGAYAALSCFSLAEAKGADRRFATYANPLDLPYRYQPELPYKRLAKGAYREAADPTVVWFKDRYWLFASHSWGYWWSKDLKAWSFVKGEGYDTQKFAPTVVVMNGRLYLAAGENASKIWTTDDPLSGQWQEAADVAPGFNDPALFLDDDGRLYMYEGLSGTGTLKIYELDPKSFTRIQSADIPASRDKASRGWEVPGDHNESEATASYIEGSWMTKRQGRYYLQYAAPGTQYKTYADGVLVAKRPMGPFVYQPYSPFSVKGTGFITGAGHGSTFAGPDGRWWHAGTMTISVRHSFERRLGLFPASFTANGELFVDTYLADYPRYIDGARALTGWMLLSRGKPVRASSTLDGFPASNAADEEVRTWWSAVSGDAGEWFEMDLGAVKTIEAVQINFADQGSIGKTISQDSYRYLLQLSDDGRNWRNAVDRSREGSDSPHDYQVLKAPERARYLRLQNEHSPDGGKFSLYDLRVFGRGDGKPPARVTTSNFARDPVDGRAATVGWSAATGAEFYVVRLGIAPNLLNQSFQVYDGTSVSVASLNKGANYCFAVDAVNENGITRGAARCIR